MPATYTLISSNVLSSSQASVTFSSIPATYTDLVLRFSMRSSEAGALAPFGKITFNSDTSSIYSGTFVMGYSTTAASYRNSNISYGKWDYYGFESAGNTSNTFGSVEIYIPNYTSTTSKPFSAIHASEDNSAGNAINEATAGLYRNSTAISNIELGASSGSFVSGSSFYLYGISNA
jgi:hypothetical protein